jgi:hypothetical protein
MGPVAPATLRPGRRSRSEDVDHEVYLGRRGDQIAALERRGLVTGD